MRHSIFLALAGIVIGVGVSGSPAVAHDSEPETPAETTASKSGLNLENLLRAQLEGVDGTEVIVSRVSMPPHTALPKHWHPGEEFGYVLEGSVILWQEGQEDIVGHAGDVLAVPLKQVHTAITKDEGAVILVFRVHEQGQPERILTE